MAIPSRYGAIIVARQYRTVAQYATETVFTEPQLRWFIFNAESNGLSKQGAIKRIGRRVYIDPEAFDRWIDSQQEIAA